MFFDTEEPLLLWPPCTADAECGHYIFALWFLLSFFSLPDLSGCRVDVYHTLHMVWP